MFNRQNVTLDEHGSLVVGHRSGGRRAAIEGVIRANACSATEADLCIDDLNRTGLALQTSDGRRIDPKPEPRGEDPRFRYMRFGAGNPLD